MWAAALVVAAVVAVAAGFMDTSGTTVIFAGNGSSMALPYPAFVGDGGPATEAPLCHPSGVAYHDGDVFITDACNNRVRRVLTSGTIESYYADGRNDVSMRNPRCVAAKGGVLWVGSNNRLRRIMLANREGTSWTFDALGVIGGITFDAAGRVFFSSVTKNKVLTFSPASRDTHFAGDPGGAAGGSPSQTTQSSMLNETRGLAFDSVTGRVLIVDSGNAVVRSAPPGGGLMTIIAGVHGQPGFSGDGGPATSAQFRNPAGIAVDSTGNVFIADSGNNRVRCIVGATRTIVTVVGGGAGGVALQWPYGIALDRRGSVFVSDGVSTVGNEYEQARGNKTATPVSQRTGLSRRFVQGGGVVVKFTFVTPTPTQTPTPSPEPGPNFCGLQASPESTFLSAAPPPRARFACDTATPQAQAPGLSTGVSFRCGAAPGFGQYSANAEALPVLLVNAVCGGAGGAAGTFFRVCATVPVNGTPPADCTRMLPRADAAVGVDASMPAFAAAGFVPYSVAADSAGAYDIDPDSLAAALERWPARACAAGGFAADPVNSGCADCPAGSFCPPPGNATPVTCPVGHYCPALSTGPMACADTSVWCPPGSSVSRPCPAGSYCPGLEDEAVQRATDALTASGAVVCPAGEYCPAGAAWPTTCPLGFACPRGTENYTVNRCPPGYVCVPGTSNATSAPCAAGFFCPPFSRTIYAFPCSPGMISRPAATECVFDDRTSPAAVPGGSGSGGVGHFAGLSDAAFSVLLSAGGSIALYLLGAALRLAWYELHTHKSDQARFPLATAVRDALGLGRFPLAKEGATLQLLVSRLGAAVPELAVAAAASPDGAAATIVAALRRTGIDATTPTRYTWLYCCIGASGSLNMEQVDARFTDVVAAIRAQTTSGARTLGGRTVHFRSGAAPGTVDADSPPVVVAAIAKPDVSRRTIVGLLLGAGAPLRAVAPRAGGQAVAAGKNRNGDAPTVNPLRATVSGTGAAAPAVAPAGPVRPPRRDFAPNGTADA